MGRARTTLPDLDLESVARLCVRHPGSDALDLLARAATRGHRSATELRDLAHTAAAHPDRPLPVRRMDPAALGWFALVNAAFLGTTVTLQDVSELLSLAHRASDGRGLEERFRDLWLDVLLLSGSTEDFPYPTGPGVAGSPAWRVLVDQLNPRLHDPSTPGREGGDEEDQTVAWLTALSEIFTRDGLAPLTLAPGGDPALHRLVCAPQGPASSQQEEAPLITVVMPVYRPDADLRFSLSSVLAQTWQNIEVLLVDDGSGKDYHGLLTELAASDPRVRLLHLPTNQGAYVARNLGLEYARGEMLTFQDADDWMHAERLRVQARPLLEDPALMATTSRMVRVDSQLALTVVGRPVEAINASSLLFRRKPVLARLGRFDPVRRAADNEFLGRLRAVFGWSSVRSVPEVLSLVQRTPGSLSREDLRLLFRDPAREHYRFCYRQWHRLLAEGRADPFVPAHGRPPVPARPRILGGAPLSEHRARVVLLGGFTPGTPTSPDLRWEVESVRSAGPHRPAERDDAADPQDLALVSLPSSVDLGVPARRPGDDIVQLIRTGEVGWVLPDEHVTASLAVVRDPESVLLLPDVLGSVHADRVLLVAGEDPAGRYDPAEVERVVLDAWRPSLVRWLPASASVTTQLYQAVTREHVLPPQPWGAVPAPDVGSWNPSPRPVVGLLQPSVRTPRQVLQDWALGTLPRSVDTTVLARRTGTGLERRLGRQVDPWRRAGMRPDELLSQVSYLLAPPLPGRNAHLHPGVVDGLRHGCVPILDASYREHFGAAAVYSDERSADEWLELHARQPVLYAEQQDRGATFLRTSLAPEAMTRTVTEVLALTTDRSRPRWLSGWRAGRRGAR